MPFCEQCGAEASSDAKFCGQCGKSVLKDGSVPKASEIEIFKEQKSVADIFFNSKLQWAKKSLSARKNFNDFMNDIAIGPILFGVTPPNEAGELGHYGNGTFSCLLTKNHIAIFNENGGPSFNGQIGFKKSTGNAWSHIFPISQLNSVQLVKGSWEMHFSNGEAQRADYWYLVLEPKLKSVPGDEATWWMHDLVDFPDRKSFKYTWNDGKHRGPDVLWMQSKRKISQDKGEGTWYLGLPFEESGDFAVRRVIAEALSREISHYPDFQLIENPAITSNTWHQVYAQQTGVQGFAFSFFTSD